MRRHCDIRPSARRAAGTGFASKTHFLGSGGLSRTTMAPDELKAARARYKVAHEAYQEVAKRIAEKPAADLVPTAEEIHEEAQAIERLAAARRELLEVMTAWAPPPRR